MTRITSIDELPRQKFSGQDIEHCFYVENMNTPEMRVVPLKDIFVWIVATAKKEGLIIELTDDRIVFK